VNLLRIDYEKILLLSTVIFRGDYRLNQYYHLGFDFDSKRQFCSKFVYLTFKEALGVELGKIQTLKELLEENPQASVNFWRCWYLGFIPWERKTITPASQLHDPQLNTVFSTLKNMTISAKFSQLVVN